MRRSAERCAYFSLGYVYRWCIDLILTLNCWVYTRPIHFRLPRTMNAVWYKLLKIQQEEVLPDQLNHLFQTAIRNFCKLGHFENMCSGTYSRVSGCAYSFDLILPGYPAWYSSWLSGMLAILGFVHVRQLSLPHLNCYMVRFMCGKVLPNQRLHTQPHTWRHPYLTDPERFFSSSCSHSCCHTTSYHLVLVYSYSVY